MTRWRVGVDSGGTFTDVCLYNEDNGSVRTWKVSSTPNDPSRGIIQAIEQGLTVASEGHSAAAEVCYFVHGTTVATNALIQKRGARTGLLTTEGFRDLLEIGRQRRPSLYDLQADKPEVLIGRDMRMEIAERVRFDGTVERTLDRDEARKVVRDLKVFAPDAVAICFLYSFICPEHEKLVREIVEEELPGIFVTASHDVAPEFREFERLSTTVLNGYLGPIMHGYLARLAPSLRSIGVTVSPHVTQSNGGIISFETAQKYPVRAVLSGPSTGVIAAQRTGEQTAFTNLITFDMGGTSTDVSLIHKGVPTLANETQVHGYPLKAPMLDINTVGAGGGSIAYVDVGGLLKVGPRSAGADPGPACYEKGNAEPTVTDANVVLHTLNPTHLLKGRLAISQAAAKAAVGALASRLSIDVMTTAQGIIDVVIANMAKAIRIISVQRGHDLREFTLVAFGGAGPLHAGRLARELEMRRIIVPPNPGILCAMGLLLAERKTNYSITRLLPLEDESLPTIGSVFEELKSQATAWFDSEGTPAADRRLKRSVDLRYARQNYEINLGVPEDNDENRFVANLMGDFEDAHERLYGYAISGDAIKLVTFRLEASVATPRIEFTKHSDSGTDLKSAESGARQVYFSEFAKSVLCPVYDRDRLRTGNRIEGPAVVEQMDATTVLLPGQTAVVDPYLNLIIEVSV